MTDNSNSKNKGRRSKSSETSQLNPEAFLGNKIPPNSSDAEKALLGSLLIDKNAISKTIEILNPESFYNEKNKIIYQTILSMSERNVTADLVTLAEELIKKDVYEAIGGTMYLTEISESTPTAANVDNYARIIQEKFLKRALISTASRILSDGYDESQDALEAIDKAEAEIFDIGEKRFTKSYVDIKTLSNDAIHMIGKLIDQDKTGLSGVPSGFTRLDNLLGGFQKSDLIILAARPSMGKTALGLSIARNVAVEYKMPIGFFSLEMSNMQLVIRLISGEVKINAQAVRTGRIGHDDLARIVNQMGRLADSPMFIDDSPTLTVTELRAKARRMKAEHDIKMIFVDYLQFVHPPKADSREREISIISRSLKQIAKELDIPVMALAQLNRAVDGRTDKRPMLSDLRESGSIEQDADVVMFIYRPEVYKIKTWDDNSATENQAEIIIAKQRNGPTDSFRLAYIKDFARFENLDLYHVDPEEYLTDKDFQDEDSDF
jgi:replicative DNA helicase